VKRRRKHITPEVVALFRRAQMLRGQGAEDDAAPEAIRDAYRDASTSLNLALGRAPWDADIFEALDEHRDTEITQEMIRATRADCVNAQWGLWKDARDLGLELEQLAREDRHLTPGDRVERGH
jgi:hypothetical protein